MCGHSALQSAAFAAAVVTFMASRPAGAAADPAFGEYLSAECVTCHQTSGRYEGIPPIVGWPDTTFIDVMAEYRTKKRDNLIMQAIAGRLSEDEISALAAYFGSLQHQPSK